MHIVILSANVGGIDAHATHDPQMLPSGWTMSHIHFDDSTICARPLSLSPRMQAKVFKMCGFDYASDADLIIWLDSVYIISSADFVSWMVEQLGTGDICLMRHNVRSSIAAELAYTTKEILKGNSYFTTRYAGEPMAEQVASYLADDAFKDEHLAAAGCFIYRNTKNMRAMLKDWMVECMKWTCKDQLSLPYVLHKHGIIPRWLNYSVFNCPHLRYMRHLDLKLSSQ